MNKKTSRPRKAKRADVNTTKSASVRFLVTPDQLASWQEAADISHEGNLSMFLRSVADAGAHDVIEKAKAAS
jgi:uncharacterized protein (DUF1778 family)